MSDSIFVLKKVQTAFVQYLADSGDRPEWLAPSSIVCGISRGNQSDPDADAGQDESVATPRVIIECASAGQTAPFSGAWRAMVTVHLEESADDTSEAGHLEHASSLLDLLFTDSIAADLSAAIGHFTAQLVVFTAQNYDLRGRLWRTSFNIEIECLGRSIG
jgi:hypothetical protein